MTDHGRAPSGQALVCDGAATHLHPTGFDPSRIVSLASERYSPNLRAWLLRYSKQRPWRHFGVFREADGMLFVGYADDDNYFIGATLNSILISGRKAEIWAYGNLVSLTPLPDFWESYAAIGRCVIDPEHRRPWQGEETRWKVDGDIRHCLWCGEHTQHLRRWTEEVKRERWESASGTLTEGGDAKQAPGDSLSGAVPKADAQPPAHKKEDK